MTFEFLRRQKSEPIFLVIAGFSSLLIYQLLSHGACKLAMSKLLLTANSPR